jgi:hypothetical protein
MSPEISNLLVPVLTGAVILFVIGYIGNMISFSNRFVNALVTAIVFAVIYGGILYFLFFSNADLPPEVKEKLEKSPELRNVSQQAVIQVVGISAVLVFVIDLIANMLSFSSRFMNALMTAIVFAVVFGILIYATGGMPTAVPA